jgi:hypothetical protein
VDTGKDHAPTQYLERAALRSGRFANDGEAAPVGKFS